HFHRRIDVQNVVPAAEFQEHATIDVPGQIDDQIARAHVPREFGGIVLGRDPLANQPYALRQERRQCLSAIDAIEDRDALGSNVDVAQEQRQCALRYASVTKHQNPTRKRRFAHFFRQSFPVTVSYSMPTTRASSRPLKFEALALVYAPIVGTSSSSPMSRSGSS